MHGNAAKGLSMRALPDPSVPTPLPCAATGDARLAGATIQPVVEATMAGIALEAAALRATVEHSMHRQFYGLSTRFEASTGKDTVN